jgi:nitrate/nitrite transporter NarK
MNSYATMAALVIVGELIFSLPFHIARFFRPTYLDVFHLTNTQLGDIFAVYGFVAMVSYFFSGIVADHFSARRLLAISMFTTALGGLYLAQVPGPAELTFLYAYWGLTTIFLFWSALIKATREWGGVIAQGKAFGALDAGRGLIAAGAASVAVFVFQFFLIDDVTAPHYGNQRAAMIAVIYLYSLLTLLGGLIILVFLADTEKESRSSVKNYWHQMYPVFGQRIIWMQAIIVLCAYCGFKGIDNYGLYAVTVLNMDEVEAARFTSLLAYIRPVAAIISGVLADRFMANKLIVWMFIVLLSSYIAVAIIDWQRFPLYLLYMNIALTAVLVFGLRGIYFALFEEVGTDKDVTGISVGIVSVIGFLPDIFFAPLAGRILDANPGTQSFQHYFMLLAVFAVMGVTASLYLRKLIKTKMI